MAGEPRHWKPLRKMQKLSSLVLSNTTVTDLAPLRELKSLSILNLSLTRRIADLKPLRELPALSILDLRKAVIAENRRARPRTMTTAQVCALSHRALFVAVL